MSEAEAPVARLETLSQRYGANQALAGITLDIPAGKMVGLIGPDGVGKSTLLAIVAGARRAQQGRAIVLGGDMADAAHRDRVCARIAYMPQGLGRNLYPDLTVRENIDFFGRLFDQTRRERAWRIPELLDATGLALFPDRLAKKLSGGMRQKLGLCCALIHDPEFLILDEPTTGIDPLSRRQFWDLIARMRARRAGMSVIVATGYMDEAEGFDRLIAMDRGAVLAEGTPQELKSRTGASSIEDAFIALLPEERRAGRVKLSIPLRAAVDSEVVIIARDLTARFGNFTAVDRATFTIERGEIFGFVGSNGSGKTTTMKLLTGLLPASSGEALLLGKPVDATDPEARYRVGYMSQSFSLYTELTVLQNLQLHARLFHLPHRKAKTRIAELAGQFGLDAYLDQNTASLPLGIRQRLSLAVAVVHEPEMLILDEPTSGVDPLARDRFWEILADLSRRQNVTIFVSTHFMNEAARCDRISLMHEGRTLVTGTPVDLIAARGVETLEEAFIAYLEDTSGTMSPPAGPIIDAESAPAAATRHRRTTTSGARRMLAYAVRETVELLRDPIRLSFALFGTALLMLIFGYGITADVDNLTFAVLDRDRTPESRAYVSAFSGSRYFTEKTPIADHAELDRRLRSGDIRAAIEIPPEFGRNLKKGAPTAVGAWVDGSMPFRAETIRGYMVGVHETYLNDPTIRTTRVDAPAEPSAIAIRFRYNQEFKSVYAMAPSSMALLLVMIPAILMAVAIVREKELGSITNLYVTPVKRLEFLLGKQLPYIVVSMVSFASLLAITISVFAVPLKGSLAALTLGALLYVTATTGVGILISAFTRTQIAALVGTAILTTVPAVQFSGMLTPVSSLTGTGAIIGKLFPMTYFLKVTVGVFTKGLGFRELGSELLTLAVFIPVLTAASLMLLRKQER